MLSIPCTGQSEARGRNRWFRLAMVELTPSNHRGAEDTRLCLDFYSRRRGRSAPVILRLTPADAVALAQAIQEAVPPPRTLPAAGSGCPQCQEPLHLAYATPAIEEAMVVQEAICHTCGACWHDVYAYCASVLQSP
ncbi:MAG: DUF6295 family protein [Candidatus Tectimicrobiota bacterium]